MTLTCTSGMYARTIPAIESPSDAMSKMNELAAKSNTLTKDLAVRVCPGIIACVWSFLTASVRQGY